MSNAGIPPTDQIDREAAELLQTVSSKDDYRPMLKAFPHVSIPTSFLSESSWEKDMWIEHREGEFVLIECVNRHSCGQVLSDNPAQESYWSFDLKDVLRVGYETHSSESRVIRQNVSP